MSHLESKKTVKLLKSLLLARPYPTFKDWDFIICWMRGVTQRSCSDHCCSFCTPMTYPVLSEPCKVLLEVDDTCLLLASYPDLLLACVLARARWLSECDTVRQVTNYSYSYDRLLESWLAPWLTTFDTIYCNVFLRGVTTTDQKRTISKSSRWLWQIVWLQLATASRFQNNDFSSSRERLSWIKGNVVHSRDSLCCSVWYLSLYL